MNKKKNRRSEYIVFIIIFFLINNISYSNSFSLDFRGYIEQEKMILGKKGELINFKTKGTWSDSLGNYGRGRCQGSGLLENKNKIITDILYFCEFEDQEYQKFWTRGSRTGSQQQAGIGTNTYIDAEGKYKKYIGVECIYAISYIKDSFHAKNKCETK
tara:strand:+ start:35 stop:508 length:474 start_codon:yes stop_codon:yes gene_type:complete